jgi:hypothetical protein
MISERRALYLKIPCQGWHEMVGPMVEGSIRYWAVQSGWLGAEGEGIKVACLVAARLLFIT